MDSNVFLVHVEDLWHVTTGSEYMYPVDVKLLISIVILSMYTGCSEGSFGRVLALEAQCATKVLNNLLE